MLSKHFPVGHPRAGEPTGFAEALKANLQRIECHKLHQCVGCGECVKDLKYHTIRLNVNLWEERAAEINSGNAVLSVREWSGKPYEKGSHQTEIARLTHLGVQRVTLKYAWKEASSVYLPAYAEVGTDHNRKIIEIAKLAANDGMAAEDFKYWFASKGLSSHLVILHFTSMRY